MAPLIAIHPDKPPRKINAQRKHNIPSRRRRIFFNDLQDRRTSPQRYGGERMTDVCFGCVMDFPTNRMERETCPA
jgi:hypothetical protein